MRRRARRSGRIDRRERAASLVGEADEDAVQQQPAAGDKEWGSDQAGGADVDAACREAEQPCRHNHVGKRGKGQSDDRSDVQHVDSELGPHRDRPGHSTAEADAPERARITFGIAARPRHNGMEALPAHRSQRVS
jgi:hypothetical protein